jgi:hypothetical protein
MRAAHQMPIFTSPFNRRHFLVLADGEIEWCSAGSRKRTLPYHAQDHPVVRNRVHVRP